MADGTAIEWTHRPGTKGETWNPVVGCSIVSPGCTNCYATRTAGDRLDREGGPAHYRGTTQPSKAGPIWTGKVALAEHKLTEPLKWSKPRTVFVNSMGDLFHESIPHEWIDRVFAVMALAPQHTFQCLTKRAGRMRTYLSDRASLGRIEVQVDHFISKPFSIGKWPLPNVWLGISAERQKEADERIPLLLETPAAIRFVSLEPLLGPIDLTKISVRATGEEWHHHVDALTGRVFDDVNGTIEGAYDPGQAPKLDWVIVGGESGPNARPMHPAWARSLRDQCTSAGVPYFFKQNGEWVPTSFMVESASGSTTPDVAWPDGSIAWGTAAEHGGRGVKLNRIGKKAAGRLLDGREWSEFPEVRT